MHVGVILEPDAKERRVALTPEGVRKLVTQGHRVSIQEGAGLGSGFVDPDYAEAGATIVGSDHEILDAANVIVGIRGVRHGLGPEHVAVGLVDPLWRASEMPALAATGAAILALEMIPRITRAQSMDVLSSMATVAGYEAVLLGASRLPRLFPLLMTAAGTVPAAQVLVLGAGVAGLQAIATARRLGSVVRAYDVRPAAAEQIASLGAKSIELEVETDSPEDEGGYAKAQGRDVNKRQQALLTPHLAESDLVITTAAVPGRRSPELITEGMVSHMQHGSVIVDLAAERGGNCTLTRADEEVTGSGVLILGPTDLESRSAHSASQMFSNNVYSLLSHLVGEDGELKFDMSDEITAGTLVARGGEVIHPRVLAAVEER